MEVSILSDKSNPNTKRREISFAVVQDDKTASREEVKQELCKRLGLNPDTTIITHMKQEFGMKRSIGVAHSYASKEQIGGAEPKYLIERLSKKGEAKAEQANAGEAKQEKGAGAAGPEKKE
ncbi:MAG: hypothetical protein M1160_01590 [Candidatus Marsarchaeota archaeon]|jgi:ribosomal protein S24E|nr:hypothetical protein [Candidatus Marsarchaeota archaeon]MCL5111556.1 hypothetical protein [Candidatus Marsarchaeota archaeon]